MVDDSIRVWICFDLSLNHYTICASAATAYSEEEIRMLTGTCSDDGAICEHNGSFEDLVCSQPVISTSWTMTATLHPATKATDSLCLVSPLLEE